SYTSETKIYYNNDKFDPNFNPTNDSNTGFTICDYSNYYGRNFWSYNISIDPHSLDILNFELKPYVIDFDKNMYETLYIDQIAVHFYYLDRARFWRMGDCSDIFNADSLARRLSIFDEDN